MPPNNNRPAEPAPRRGGIVRTNKHPCGYANIDKRPLNDRRLSWKARGLLCYLLGKPEDWVVLLNALAKDSPGGIGEVRSIMNELRRAGYARLWQRRSPDGRRAAGWQWTVYDTPQRAAADAPLFDQKARSLHVENRNAENSRNPLHGRSQHSASLHAENPTVPITEDVPTTEGSSNDPRRAAGRIYDAYPRHIAKPKALASIDKAIKSLNERGGPPAGHTSWDAWLLARVPQFAECRCRSEEQDPGDDRKFTPYPATWFNQQRYDDAAEWEPRTQRKGASTNGRTISQNERRRPDSDLPRAQARPAGAG